jgi:hypothetical protein
MDDLDDRLHAALHEAHRGRPDGQAAASGRARVVAGVRARRARRARAAAGGALAAVALAVTAVVVSQPAGTPTRSAVGDRPAVGPPVRPVPQAGPVAGGPAGAAPQSSADAEAPSTTGPPVGPGGPCLAVSVDGRSSTWCTGTVPTPSLAVGQTVAVQVPAADAPDSVRVSGPALRAEGGDRFVAVAPGRSALSLTGSTPSEWSVTVTVS